MQGKVRQQRNKERGGQESGINREGLVMTIRKEGQGECDEGHSIPYSIQLFPINLLKLL
jgi:hypothetical protein